MASLHTFRAHEAIGGWSITVYERSNDGMRFITFAECQFRSTAERCHFSAISAYCLPAPSPSPASILFWRFKVSSPWAATSTDQHLPTSSGWHAPMLSSVGEQHVIRHDLPGFATPRIAVCSNRYRPPHPGSTPPQARRLILFQSHRRNEQWSKRHVRVPR